MWASLTLDSSSLKESQALRLVGMKGEHGNTPETVQAGSLRPLRDTGPSGLKEKKVRLRHRAGVSLKDKSHCWAGSILQTGRRFPPPKEGASSVLVMGRHPESG